MQMIKLLSHDIRENIHEAREKIGEAYKLHDKDKATADWYRDMAAAHLRFNDAGHQNVARLIDEVRHKPDASPLTPGMLAVYEDMHADIIRENAEVQAMIAAYK